MLFKEDYNTARQCLTALLLASIPTDHRNVQVICRGENVQVNETAQSDTSSKAKRNDSSIHMELIVSNHVILEGYITYIFMCQVWGESMSMIWDINGTQFCQFSTNSTGSKCFDIHNQSAVYKEAILLTPFPILTAVLIVSDYGYAKNSTLSCKFGEQRTSS